MQIKDVQMVGSAAVAEAIGITQRRVQQLSKAGIFKPEYIAGFAQYDAELAKEQYSNYLNQLTKNKEQKRNELIGQRFGRLVVINHAEVGQYNHAQCQCACDCGNTTIVRISKLLHNHTKSCGKCRGKQHQRRKNDD